MYNDLAILVNSCDKYEDAWDPFFKLLSIQWKNHPTKVYLNTENKDYGCKFMDVKVIKTGKNLMWTDRVKFCLENIREEHILFFLEDFFILSPVDEVKFQKVFNDFKKNEEIGFVWFASQTTKGTKRIGEYFIETPKKLEWRVNATVGLWRKDFLVQMLYKKANPWLFESRGSRISCWSKYKCVYIPFEDGPIIDYKNDPKFGYGITMGKWLNKNKELFNSYQIEVDMSKLGVMQEDVTYSDVVLFSQKTQKTSFKQKVFRILVPNKLKTKVKTLIWRLNLKQKRLFKKYCKELKNNNNKYLLYY